MTHEYDSFDDDLGDDWPNEASGQPPGDGDEPKPVYPVDFSKLSDEEFAAMWLDPQNVSEEALRETYERSKRAKEDEAFRSFAGEHRSQADAIAQRMVEELEAKAILRADEERELISSVDWDSLDADEFFKQTERIMDAQDRIAARYPEVE